MESLYLEYKEKFPKQKNDKVYETLVKEIIAFLNSSGGIIKIGVTDKGEPVGIEENMEHIERIMRSIIDRIAPSAMTNIDYVLQTTNDINILEITVTEGARKVYYNKIFGKCEAGAFFRSGTSAVGLSQENIEELETKQFTTVYDLKSPIQNLTFHKLCSKSQMELDEIIVEFDLSNEEFGFNYGAYLLSDQNTHKIDIYRFLGLDRTTSIANKTINDAPLFEQFYAIMDYFEGIIHNVIIDTKSVRREKPSYDIEIIRESIINAIVHNDYSKKDTIKIHLFNNRIEIHNRVEEKHIKNPSFLKQSRVVNASLFKCLKYLHIIEGQGIGYNKIVKHYGVESFYVDKDDCSITVIIPEFSRTNTTNQSNEEKILLEIIKGNNTSSKLLENLEFKKTTLSLILNKMIAENSIERKGVGKNTYYVLKK